MLPSRTISPGLRRVLRLAIGLSSLCLVVTCAPTVAAPTSGPGVGIPEPGRFVWHELLTVDRVASQKFYSALLGWTFHEAGHVRKEYTLIQQGFDRIGGIVQTTKKQEDGPGSQWLSYIDVADVDGTTERFRQAGAKVEIQPQEIANGVARVSVVTDTQGALLGLVRFHRILPIDVRPAPVNRFLWMEYVATDVDAALAQYRSTVGFKDRSTTEGGFTYYLLSTDIPRAGLFKSPWENVRSNWLPYIRVEDPAAVAARAAQLGGTIILAPRPDVRKGTLAIIQDPVGAVVALQKWPM